MNKLFTLFALILMSFTSFSQQVNPSPSLTKQDYLNKSHKQKKTGWILLGSGATLFITGLVIPKGELTDQFNYYTFEKDIYENDGLKAGFMIAGTLSMLGSVPFFIASGKNKKKAASISFKNYSIPVMRNGNLVKQTTPMVCFKVNL